jgi:uncharacterized PurR-regulated membrane protein YhhQ (DUF165 family)
VLIGGYNFAASGLIFPLSFFFASIITEVYGYNLAGRIVWVQLLCQVLFVIIINIFVLLPSPEISGNTSYYFNIYHNFWRVLLAGSIALTCSYFLNDFIISRLKIYMYGGYFTIRFILSNALGNALLVIISYPINFYHLHDINFILELAFNTWIYKISVATILLPIAIFFTNIVKRVEKLDYFDYGISYNPITVFRENISGQNKYEEIYTSETKWYRQNYSNQ